MTPDQKAYETWVGYVYGSYDDAVLHGYHTWEKLPQKVKDAWRVTVDFIMNGEKKDETSEG